MNHPKISQTIEPESLELRKEIALSVAKECIQLLKDNYAVTEVILFGSLAGDSPWHWASDVDLAVLGLSNPQWWKAYGELESLCPGWLKVDLIQLEDASPQLRCRILKEQPIPDNMYLALKIRIEDELIRIDQTWTVVETILAQAETLPEIVLTPSLASYLSDLYAGFERISERVAVTLDGGMPRGENWHQELLRQVAEPGGRNRPPLWQGSLLLALDDYQKFRHLVVHRYKVDLQGDRVLELAQNMQPLLVRVRAQVMVFNEWLESQVTEEMAK